MNIIFEDKDILVLSKPAGITVNRSDTTHYEKTLQEWVEEYLKVPRVSQEEARGTRDTLGTRDTFLSRAGIVHRLDKETSGVLIIAKNPSSFENLQAQFKNRTVKKIYLALVHGIVAPEEGDIRVPVGRLPWNRKRFGVLAGGRDAITKYKVLSIKYLGEEPLSLVQLFPETGRTHQIRVHLKHIGHPIFADFLYAGRKTARNDRKLLGRVFLHASKISFTNPKTGESISFEASLPEELEKFLKTLV
ncbi:MAG: hypothetical protein A3D75_02425 [Candidatus Levybacteria bacterium RIFCSPHIGHO2_02_FULL_37_18]|nr:MAG: hypothetical protein A2770_04800 [Candidatus Levybacteria bacterium RIFCSPHIGHO2_01_FULL_38_12]OGH21575.1 MAG: hypothetical protein A3D75_02425 [Candidatus Levybacteria bacterium RIFCSPHIGHO2_02_FULL_37_18]OGH34740.1 MAG: hypothetical protein A3A47_01105 [Candidatus Levybacteria bacterium RIFCSPLOWO2_01_FULL_37_20]OGH43587.1 MAG: hypothetical protein A3J14_03340 [Candidatus Levybacteria bacterium RIFCSPLOWO2_02_FULL_37_18]OGH51278.1 MAG: hypothetical protein A3G13_02415 [Candidatus Levy